MSLNIVQFHAGIVLPTLQEIAPVIPYSVAADKQTTETIWHESDHLRALGQYPRGGITLDNPFGPGLGIASIERPTWDWMMNTGIGQNAYLFSDDMPEYEDLVWDLRLNVFACRLRYRLDKRPLPDMDNLQMRASYWLHVYNGSPDHPERMHKYIADAMMLSWEDMLP